MPKRVEVIGRVQDAHSKLLEGFSCTAVVAFLAETKGVSRRTAQRTVQQAYALIREDIDKANVQPCRPVLTAARKPSSHLAAMTKIQDKLAPLDSAV